MLETGDRIVGPAERPVGFAQIAVEFRDRAVDFDRAAQVPRRTFQLAGLAEDAAQQIMRVGMPRRLLQHAQIDRFGLLKTAGGMGLEALIEQGRNGCLDAGFHSGGPLES